MKKIFNKIIELFREFSFRDFLKLLSDANVEETRKSFVTLWVIVVFIIIIVTWAAVSEINQVVRANGEVTPESQVHLIKKQTAR